LVQAGIVGFINAVTAREYATVDNAGSRYQDEVEPLTYYGILRAQKDINGGQQGLGLMATGVMRDINSESLSAILNKNAFTLAADGWSFLDKKRSWVVGGWLGGSFIEGSQEDIYRLQQSPMHYFQRPDVTHVNLNPEATTLNGWAGQFKLGKQQGNSLFLLSAGALSPGFDPNDAGFQSMGSDLIDLNQLSVRKSQLYRFLEKELEFLKNNLSSNPSTFELRHFGIKITTKPLN